MVFKRDAAQGLGPGKEVFQTQSLAIEADLRAPLALKFSYDSVGVHGKIFSKGTDLIKSAWVFRS